MKVKIGNKIYYTDKEPVMVILTEQDKKNIANMVSGATRYCMYPATKHWMDNEYKNILEWMKDVGEEE